MARFSKVFISSTSKDLKEYRDEVYKLVAQKLGLVAVAMEDFGAMSDEPSEACLDKVQECDLFIGFYARRYGFIPEDSGGLSITEMEYDKAKQEGKPILCYWLDDKCEWPEDRVQTEKLDLLQQFKQKIQKKHVVETFTTPDNLCLKILTAIAREQNKQEDTLADLDLPLNISLPVEPYLGLQYFRKEHARIFFGRNNDIRELYDSLIQLDVILLSGQSGCGKSSLLSAGLMPRMEKKNWQCIYARVAEGEALQQVEVEIQNNAQSGRYLIIIDQLEEIFINDSSYNESRRNALETLLVSKSSTDIKFILSFRKEFLLEVKKLVSQTKLEYGEVLLSNLNRSGIIEAIRGITSSGLTRKYKVEFEADLAEEIAGDIINDRESNVAPLLQILLRKMYDSCPINSNDKRIFSQNLYYQFKTASLEEMLDTQMSELGRYFPEAQESGLDLDMLYRLTTDHGSGALGEQEFHRIYCHLPIVDEIINHLVSLFLIIRISKDGQSDKILRLAHDSLSLFIRKKHQNSEAPGPKAHKILTNRQKEIESGQFVELTRNDLETIEKGRNGMRCLSEAEELIIKKNHQRLQEREQELEEKNKKLEQQNVQLNEANQRMKEMTRMVVKGLSKGLVNAARLSYEMKNYSRAFRLAEQALRIQRDSIEANNLLIQVYNHIPFLSDLTGFLGEFKSFYYSADGNLILTVYADYTAAIWNPEGKLLSKLEGHTKAIMCAHFASDGEHIVTGSMDGTARIWRTDGTCSQILTCGDPILQADIAINGNILIISRNAFKIWNLQGTLLLEKRVEYNSWIVSAGFSVEGRKVLIATNARSATIWDIISQTAIDIDVGEGNNIIYAVLAPSGYLVAIAYSTSTVNRISLWSIEGQLLASTDCVGVISGGKEFAFSLSKLIFSPDNRYILGLCKYQPPLVVIWNLRGERIGAFGKEHDQEIIDLSCSDDSQRVMTASLDGSVKVWTLPEGKLLIDHHAHQQAIQSASFIKGSDKIISIGQDQSIFIWPGKQAVPNIFVRHQRTIFSAVYSPDGKKILTTSRDGSVAIWDTDGNELRRITVTPPSNRESGVFRATFSPDGFRIVTSGLDGTVKIWNFHGDLIATLHGHIGSVYEATFPQDGEYILTSSADHTVRVWNNDGVMLKMLEGHTGKVYSASFSNDSKTILSASNDGQIIVWRDWQNNLQQTHIGKSENIKTPSIFRAVFSPDEKLILCACKDGAIRIWKLDGILYKTIQAHDPGVEVLWADFSPDGCRIVTASTDKLVKIFNVDDGQLIASLQGHTREVTCAIFSPDGQKVLSTSSDRTVKIWETAPEQIIQNANMRGVGFLHRRDLMDFEIAMAHSSVSIDNVQEMLNNGAYLPNLHQYALYYWELAKRPSRDSLQWLEKAKILYEYLKKEVGLRIFSEEYEQILNEMGKVKDASGAVDLSSHSTD